jgi:5-(carboxyamino)imidazole ribonucleotide mutase
MKENNMEKVVIIMGSTSDLDTMKKAAEVLDELGIIYEMKVLSAHRTPDLLFEYIEQIEEKGFKVIIAGAGGAAHLPGVIASQTLLPVIGVPIETKVLGGLDSLLSMVQMPGGVPVATMGIGNAKNAGLMAARILAINNMELRKKLENYKKAMVQKIKDIKI